MIQDIKSVVSDDPPHRNVDEHGAPQPTDPSLANIAATVADPKKPSKFSQIMGGILGGALNLLAPGSGSLIASLIRGGGTQFGTMEDLVQRSAQQQMEMLVIQDQMQTQTQTFSAISNLLRARHDAEMVAVNNFKS